MTPERKDFIECSRKLSKYKHSKTKYCYMYDNIKEEWVFINVDSKLKALWKRLFNRKDRR